MAERFVGMNLKNFVRSVVYKGRRLLHIHLGRIDFQKG
jgi:hypothetical protein